MSNWENSEQIRSGILRILKTKTPKHKLNAALDVIEEFKKLESSLEWMEIPFAAWTKLEQLEDALRLMTGRDNDQVTDEVMLTAWKEVA